MMNHPIFFILASNFFFGSLHVFHSIFFWSLPMLTRMSSFIECVKPFVCKVLLWVSFPPSYPASNDSFLLERHNKKDEVFACHSVKKSSSLHLRERKGIDNKSMSREDTQKQEQEVSRSFVFYFLLPLSCLLSSSLTILCLSILPLSKWISVSFFNSISQSDESFCWVWVVYLMFIKIETLNATAARILWICISVTSLPYLFFASFLSSTASSLIFFLSLVLVLSFTESDVVASFIFVHVLILAEEVQAVHSVKEVHVLRLLLWLSLPEAQDFLMNQKKN
jgi:hypothetical protein